MFGFLKKAKEPSTAEAEASIAAAAASQPPPSYSFADDGYAFPNLFEEADEMSIVALLMYTMTELRALAKQDKVSHEILKLPITLEKTLQLIHDNLDAIKSEIEGHEMVVTALQSIQEHFVKVKQQQSSSTSNDWWNPFATAASRGDTVPACLTAFGDEKPDKELVYAVGVNPLRKRVTVAFRGSVTSVDFFTDACIELNRRPNPVKEGGGCGGNDNDKAATTTTKDKTIGIHAGFDQYLLKGRKVTGGETKYDEIIKHVKALFAQDNRLKEYKLYVTGHSLGGALACLFGFEAAAEADPDIPLPVTVVSVASPRVGDSAFQEAFSTLERKGRLRHLRIAHAQDPVTMMPKTSSRRILAAMSPIVFVTLALSDALYTSSETYRHTGVKLRLMSKPNNDKKLYEISYQGTTTVLEEAAENEDKAVAEKAAQKPGLFGSGRNSMTSWSFAGVPGVDYHFGPSYSEQLIKCREDLSAKSLNAIYARYKD